MKRVFFHGTTYVCAHEAVRSATAELAGIRPSRVRVEHARWAYPEFDHEADPSEPSEWNIGDDDDAVYDFAGARPNYIGVSVGQHAHLNANGVGRTDYWWVDGGEYWFVEPATIKDQVRVIKSFVERQAFFASDRMYRLYGLPDKVMREIEEWEEKLLGPTPTDWDGPRKSIIELLDEEPD